MKWRQVRTAADVKIGEKYGLGGFEGTPVVVHRDLAGEFFQAHPAGVAAIFVEGGTNRTRHIIDVGEVAEVFEFLVVQIPIIPDHLDTHLPHLRPSIRGLAQQISIFRWNEVVRMECL